MLTSRTCNRFDTFPVLDQKRRLPTTKVLGSGKWHCVVFINQNLTRNRVAQKPREAKKGQQ